MKYLMLFVMAMAIDVASSAQVTDIDGKEYKTEVLNGDEWMLENLAVKHFRNGDAIYHAQSKEDWAKAGEDKRPAWCEHPDDATLTLYNFYAVTDPRGLAPKGWKVPDVKTTEALWKSLKEAVKVPEESNEPMLHQKLFEKWTKEHAWYVMGSRFWDGDFSSGLDYEWWSSSDFDGAFAFRFGGGTSPQPDGKAIRCIKG